VERRPEALDVTRPVRVLEDAKGVLQRWASVARLGCHKFRAPRLEPMRLALAAPSRGLVCPRRPAPAWRCKLGDHGHPLAIFHRAIERGNVLVAEATARELGSLLLADALDLTALVARHDRVRGRRMAARWLERWLTESKAPMIDEAAMVASALAALGGPAHEQALRPLRDMIAARPNQSTRTRR
jgi:hypothetical protein